jgi:hypothetical protein
MRELIAFTDYYPSSSLGTFTETLKIIDPVNAKNNVSKLYTAAQADAIVDAALGRRRCDRFGTGGHDEAGDRPLLAEGLRLGLSGMKRT